VAAPVQAAPERAPVTVGADAPSLSAERFCKLFVAEVYDLRLERGRSPRRRSSEVCRTAE
jgi:hypothetical protein